MSQDPTTDGVSEDLLRELGLDVVSVERDDVLMIGVKETFANLVTPMVEEGPMDTPTKGIAMLCGGLAGVSPGTVCFFPKFSSVEIHIGSRRFFVAKASDIRAQQRVTPEEMEILSHNTF